MPSNNGFSIEVNFLTGRYVATRHSNRQLPEWPPHPARLYSALVATWADTDEPDSSEREALEWLESQGPPGISASGYTCRSLATNFVPVNDTSVVPSRSYKKRGEEAHKLSAQLDAEYEEGVVESTRQILSIKKRLTKLRDIANLVNSVGKTSQESALTMLPEHRKKQARYYPSVTPDDSRMSFVWNLPAPDEVVDALDGLLCRVTRLGHSSSLVSCRFVASRSPINYEVRNSGDIRIRSIQPGQIDQLERQYKCHEGNKPRSLPYVNVRYRQVEKNSQQLQSKCSISNTSGQWIVFEFDPRSRSFPVTRSIEIAKAMRAAIFHYANDPIPEELSGHLADGTPVATPHVGFHPLPYVGFKKSDGRLLGIALSIPDSVSSDVQQVLYRAIGDWEAKSKKVKNSTLHINLSTQGVIHLTRQRGFASLVTLRQKVWTRKSDRWVSATPVALPRHPGKLSGGTTATRAKAWVAAEKSIMLACEHVGLPKPLNVNVSHIPYLVGSKPAHHFPAFYQNGPNNQSLRRQLVHVSLVFEQPVAGPLSLGSGRFLGLGLMRPMN